MMPEFEKEPLIKALLFFVGILVIVIVIRYLILREIDFGFAFIIAVLLLFIYFLIQRLLHYIRSKEI
jgi:cell division protein FtsW (lipid II flippase)